MTGKRPRIYAIDLARGLAVLYMILVHVLDVLGAPHVADSVFGTVVDFLGGPPAAPVFMAAMGMSFYFSRNTDLGAGVRRGLYIIFLGYALNFVRGVVPVFAIKTFAPSSAASIPAGMQDYTDAFLDLDILQFAGLSLIVMAFIRRYNLNRLVLLVAAVAVALASPLLWGLETGQPVLDRLLDLFWGDRPTDEPFYTNMVAFPFFPWFSYVLVGMFLGITLKGSDNVNRVFAWTGLAGVAALAISLIWLVPDYARQMNDYYHPRPGYVLFATGVVLLSFYGCSLLEKAIQGSMVSNLLIYWSKNVNTIYMAQWVLIMWSAFFVFGFYNMDYLGTILLMIGLCVATHLANVCWLKARPGMSRLFSRKAAPQVR